MDKLKPGEENELVWGHVASEWQSMVQKPASSSSDSQSSGLFTAPKGPDAQEHCVYH